MTDNIDKGEIRKAIDRLQAEHPCHFTFDVTLFNHDADFGVIQRAIDMVAKKCQDDADIHIICEMAKLYLEGVRPMVKPKQEWILCSERLPEEKINPITHDFEEVLGTTIWGDVRHYKYGTPIGHDEAHFWYGFGTMDEEVIAWMPLPEPYKRGEAE